MKCEENHKKVYLWLVRHGETLWNSTGKLAGWSDVPLTPKGEEQAKSLAETLADCSFKKVWSSDLVRAVTTARLAYGEPVQDKRLREINFGNLEGCNFEDIDEEHRKTLVDFKGFSAPEGESLETFGARIEGFVGSLEPGRHLIFTHGGVIRLLTWQLGLDTFVSNGALVIVDWTEQKLLGGELR